MVSAFLSSPAALSTLATKLDANFGQDTIREGEVIDFGEWSSENHSRDAAKFLFNNWLTRFVLPTESAISAVESPSNAQVEERTNHEVSVAQSTGAINVQNGRSFHLYANYLVHQLAQQSKATVGA